MKKRIKQSLLLLALLQIETAYTQGGIFPLTPFNADTIETSNPLFSWYVADGSTSNQRETYTYRLGEMGSGQSPEEAVNTNIPVIREDNLSQQQLLYPIEAPQLKKNVWYAWQVQKYTSNSLTDRSEAWKFIISDPVKKESMKYAKLKKKNDGTYYEAYNGKIYFMMDEKYRSQQITVNVYDSEQKIVAKEVKIDQKDNPENGAINGKAIGSNFYELDLGSLSKTGSYELETFDEKGKRYILPFVVR